MTGASPLLLIVTVAAVGVLHTLVPDHWAPIALLARQQGWTRATAMRVAAGAGLGHTVSTLAIAVLVWIAGATLAQRFGNALTAISALLLVAFGLWIAIAALRELQTDEHHHAHFGHVHWHAHEGTEPHRHWHEHHDGDWHYADGALALAARPATPAIPVHEHAHPRRSARTALLLVAGSSPMVEGIPAFLAASKLGVAQLAVMSAVFAACTIATYVVLVALSTSGLERVSFGRFERYGEVISGVFVAIVGCAFFFIG